MELSLSGMALEKMNLSNNRLRSIPTPPTYLISLDLENNMLTALPDMSNMEYLQEFFLSGNPIKGWFLLPL
jgi:Leucine-rich repeat (LRR) protein